MAPASHGHVVMNDCHNHLELAVVILNQDAQPPHPFLHGSDPLPDLEITAKKKSANKSKWESDNIFTR